jgi:hypothetical protein
MRMLNQHSRRVQDCYRRADDCARRAEVADAPELRKFWEEQETRWVRIAGYSEFSERIGAFLRTGRPEPKDILQEEALGLDGLADVFNRVCLAMNIDAQDGPASRAIAQTLIAASMAGVEDSDALFDLAMRAAAA